MKKRYRYIVLAAVIIAYSTTNAQSTTGITNIPDTSYTTYSAFISNKKKYPDIKIAEEFHSKSVKEKKNITYCLVGKRKLQLDAFYPFPKTKQKRAAIMILHGGGWRSGNRTQHYPLAQRLANLSYVCFTPEYRLSTEALYPAAVYDLKAAVRWIHANAKAYNIDTNKIAVLGFSAGGQLAALLATTNNQASFEGTECNLKYSSNIHALLDLDGTLSFVHPESGEADDSKRISASTYWFGYSKKDNFKLLEDASPLKHVDKNTPPTLFINSSVERMHAGRTDFIKVLDQYGIYSEIKTFADAPHSFPLFDPWFEPMVKYVDEFLKKIFFTTTGKK
jgi:acetyl esterase/lipase